MPRLPRYPIQKKKRGVRRRWWHPKDIPLVIAMLRAGYSQDDIAVYFGQNGGRISEVNTGKCEAAQNRRGAPATQIPAPGPYPPGRAGLLARQALLEEKDLHLARITAIDAVIAQMDVWTDPGPPVAAKKTIRAKRQSPLDEAAPTPSQGSFPLQVPAGQLDYDVAPLASPQPPSECR